MKAAFPVLCVHFFLLPPFIPCPPSFLPSFHFPVLELYCIVLSQLVSRIEYSEKYMDENFEYRHVILPKELAKTLPKGKLLSDAEWRAYGVQQSRGWEHYAIHKPEPHILLFRRALGTDPVTGKVNLALKESALEAYNREYGMELGRK